jgi:hypothetical protein
VSLSEARAHLALAAGAWTLDGQQRIGGVVPVNVTAKGRLLEGRETNSTLTGYVEVGQTALLPLFDMLRATNLAEVPSDSGVVRIARRPTWS